MNTVDTDRANEFDVLIVGGGMVGASLAAALAPLQIRVGLVEAIPFQASAQPSYDDRVTVVAEGSRRILSTIGLWEHISAQTTPITKIHVSEKKRFGITRLNAEDYDVAALGYVVENRVLGAALGGYIDTRDSIDLICPAKLRSVKTDSVRVDVVITRGESEETLHTKLLVAADGARSLVREQLGIKARIWDYGQTAIVCNVTPEREHANQAYERFTNSGPVALLPMPDARCAVVWTVATTQAEQLLALPDDEFASRLQTVFGHRLGAFTRMGARHPYPLHLVRAQRQSSERVVIIGNAAHSLHPIAGQGFNLSLRDVAALAEVIFE
ncbi:MAG: 2-octaprenyl-6-methoxyphenyl hydroxylase, partial [Gammaproteobacteria bacterium]|nr:2-octaprenyl-6-methoxyphenyl hydroxylase [Gammaproteobacteria bacterium]